MNTMKKNGGFTLVELIIVIAILAILSTGAIAGYSAYIKSANDAAVKAVLSDIYTSAVLANAQTGDVTVTVTEKDANTLTIKVEDVGDKFETNFESSLKVGTANSDTNDGVYTGEMEKPDAWNNSSYHTTDNKWSSTLPVAE